MKTSEFNNVAQICCLQDTHVQSYSSVRLRQSANTVMAQFGKDSRTR